MWLGAMVLWGIKMTLKERTFLEQIKLKNDVDDMKCEYCGYRIKKKDKHKPCIEHMKV